MFTRGAFRKAVPSVFELIKRNPTQISNGPLRRFSTLDIRITYVPNAESRRLYAQEAKPQPMIADYDYVKRATKDKNVLLIDVREPDELKEHGSIPNSVNIPLSSVTSVLSSMTEKEFQQTFKRAKPNPNTEIIFYCMIGKRSRKAQQNAIDLGYKNTKNYLGSWTEWNNKEK